MPDQPLDKLSPANTIAKGLKKRPNKEPNAPGHGRNKETRLRNLIAGGAWNNDPIGLIAWIEHEKRWYKWDRLR